MAADEQYAQALRDVARLEQQVRDLKAAFLPFVNCNFTYFSGKVLGSDAKLTREQVERARTLIACPTHGTTSTPGCRACRELIDAEVAAEVARGVREGNPCKLTECKGLPRCAKCVKAGLNDHDGVRGTLNEQGEKR